MACYVVVVESGRKYEAGVWDVGGRGVGWLFVNWHGVVALHSLVWMVRISIPFFCALLG